MIRQKTDADILFSRIRNVAIKRHYKSKAFIEFVMSRHPGKTFHHVFGSVFNLKSTDLLGVPVVLKEHLEGEENRDWIIQQMPEAIDNLLLYVEYLEGKVKE